MRNMEKAIKLIEEHRYISYTALCWAMSEEGVCVGDKKLQDELKCLSKDENSPVGVVGEDGVDALVNAGILYSRKWFSDYGTSGKPNERIGCHLYRLICENGWQHPMKDMSIQMDAEFLLCSLKKEKKNGIILSADGLPPFLHEFVAHYAGVCPARCENGDYIVGLKHLQEGDIEYAWRSFLSAAHSGCAQAEYRLGRMILDKNDSVRGELHIEDLLLSRDAATLGGEYLIKAAKHGYPVAQYAVGCEYLKASSFGHGSLEDADNSSDETSSQKMFSAAAAGIGDFLTGCDVEAECVAAEMYYLGRGFERDKNTAMSLLHSAIKHGSLKAEELLQTWENG